ncbi:hypothetical protein Tsubulata_032878, partial [Turnera subulata]
HVIFDLCSYISYTHLKIRRREDMSSGQGRKKNKRHKKDGMMLHRSGDEVGADGVLVCKHVPPPDVQETSYRAIGGSNKRLKAIPSSRGGEGSMICNSLQDIRVCDCPELKRMPFSFSSFEDGRPSSPLSEEFSYFQKNGGRQFSGTIPMQRMSSCGTEYLLIHEKSYWQLPVKGRLYRSDTRTRKIPDQKVQPTMDAVLYSNGSVVSYYVASDKFTTRSSATGVMLHLSGDGGSDVTICKEVSPEVQQKAYQAVGGSSKRPKATPRPRSGGGCSNCWRVIMLEEVRNTRGIEDWDPPRFEYGKHVLFSCCNIGEKGASLMLPEDVEELSILDCHDVSSLCDATPSLSRATCLKTISVEHCEALQSLLSLSELSSNSDALQSVEELIICDLRKLESIYRGSMICDSLEEVRVLNCPMLKRMPFSLPSFENGRASHPLSFRRITVSPKEWWDTVHWDQPDIPRRTCRLAKYCLLAGKIGDIHPESKCKKRVLFECCNIEEKGAGMVLLPKDVEELSIVECHDVSSLCDASPSLSRATHLKNILVLDCQRMQCLLSLACLSSNSDALQSLERLQLSELHNLQVLISGLGIASPPWPSICFFSRLKSICIFDCAGLRILFPLGLLPNLQNLESIQVGECKQMEELLETEGEEQEGISSSVVTRNLSFSLPKLRCLDLSGLPRLKNIYRGSMICNSLEDVIIWYCPNLERMPFSLPSSENGQPSPPLSLRRISICPKKWWDAVQWDHPDAKDILLPLCLGKHKRRKKDGLETLVCDFWDPHDLKSYLFFRPPRLSQYYLLVGKISDFVPHFKHKKQVLFSCCRISKTGDRVVLPEDVEELSIVECHDVRSLCDASPSLSLATRLKTLSVVGCEAIQCLLSLSQELLYVQKNGGMQFSGTILMLRISFCLFIWECGFCKHQFAQGTSATGITLHFSGVEVEGDGIGGDNDDFVSQFKYRKQILFPKCNDNEERAFIELPEDIEELNILEWHDVSSVCDAFPSIVRATSLKAISVRNCDAMQCLLSLSRSGYDALRSLEELRLCKLSNLQVLFGGKITFPPLPSNFSRLKTIYISLCPSLRTLFPFWVLPNIQNLEKIEVKYCDQLEELVGTKGEEGGRISGSIVTRNLSFSLPKLRSLILSDLPRLENIYGGSMICDSLEEVTVLDCPNLKRMPFSLPSFENGRPTAPLSFKRITVSPKEWWDAVQWDHPNAKDKINSGWYIQIRTMCRITTET